MSYNLYLEKTFRDYSKEDEEILLIGRSFSLIAIEVLKIVGSTPHDVRLQDYEHFEDGDGIAPSNSQLRQIQVLLNDYFDLPDDNLAKDAKSRLVLWVI